MIAWLLACAVETEPLVPYAGEEVCDAGDDAWVQRTIPLLWGRKAHGAFEVDLWAAVAQVQGRDVVVRAMTGSAEYVGRWTDWLDDALFVARTGDREYASCFASPLLPEDRGELATWLATADTASAYPAAFNMADVVRSSLQADDLSGAYRVNLFARMNRPMQGANVGPYEMEESRRQAFGEDFDTTYLHRNLVCIGCHNSEYSVTDEASGNDRHWPVAGLFERALYGSSFGEAEATAFQPWRYTDLMASAASTEAPWGIDSACGRFAPPGSLDTDFLGHEGYFIEAFGESGSVWNVEALLAEGVTQLADRGLVVAGDGTVDGPDAFAFLVGMNIVDQVWREAAGERLTIANYFPRNDAQRIRLEGFARHFVEERFSLRELLVDITTDPYFNAGVGCGASPYGMAAVTNPWTDTEADPARRGNGPGDLVHRHSARTLLRSVHDAMGWPQPEPFLAGDDPIFRLQGALGAFLRASQPGFNGTDFQGALAFEATYGACASPDVGGAGNGCVETLGYGGCASCECQTCACALDPYCCDVQWDALCVESCNDACGGCGGGLSEVTEDSVDRILSAAKANDATLREVVLGLKDRLVARGTLSDAEESLIASLIGAPLDTRLSDAPNVEPHLRVFCGALLLSPEFFLVMDAGDVGPVPGLAMDTSADCANAQALLSAWEVEVTCSS